MVKPVLVAFSLLGLAASCGPCPGGKRGETAAPAWSASALAGADRPLPVDPRFRVGRLPNGVTYYIAANREPGQRAELRLAVNAGSLMEDDDQRGLAHFVEHMAFNGTEKYDGQAIAKYLESLGMQFGADLNATTDYDATVYRLQIPTSERKHVEAGVGILREFASRVKFAPAEIEKERGVILEELRARRTAGVRLGEKQSEELFAGSRYAGRAPTGDTEIISRASRETLLRFYRDWYRPELMAVVAVGDFDVAEVEAIIRAQFSDLVGAPRPRLRREFALTPPERHRMAVATDAETSAVWLQLVSVLDAPALRSEADLRRNLTIWLLGNLLAERLNEVSGESDAPWTEATVGWSPMVRWSSTFSLQAGGKRERLPEALRRMVVEMARVERQGFARAELERIKRAGLQTFEQKIKNRTAQTSDSMAQAALDHHLEGDSFLDAEQEHAIVTRILPAISNEEIMAAARALGSGAQRVVLLSGPSALEAPAEQQMLSQLAPVTETFAALNDDADEEQPLLAGAPTPGRVVKERAIGKTGVVEWRLDNGARVLIKPTRSETRQIMMEAVSPGGLSLVAETAMASAHFAAPVVVASGFGRFGPSELRKQLFDKNVALQVSMADRDESVSGSAAPDQVETLLQLTHLVFTAPHADPSIWADSIADAREQLASHSVDPEQAFSDELNKVLTGNHPRYRSLSAEQIEQAQPETMLQVFRQRFSGAADFTFVFVGDVDPAALRPLVERYIGSLPAGSKKERSRDHGVRYPRGVKRFTVRRGQEARGRVTMLFVGADAGAFEGWMDLQLVQYAVEQRLRAVLREDLGKVYDVEVSGAIDLRNHERMLRVSFVCDPKNAQKLERRARAELDKLRRDGVEARTLTQFKQLMRRRGADAEASDEFWVEVLRYWVISGGSLSGISRGWRTAVARATPRNARAAARHFLAPRGYVAGFLLPEVDPPRSARRDPAPTR